jgi:galactonate dehydratase
MKITSIETYIVDAGWRPWTFVVMQTDQGVTGYGECSDGKNPYGVAGVIEDMKPLLLGTDPRAYELRFWDMIRSSRQSPGGVVAKGIAGLELAMVDIKAKALGISVTELFGGPTRQTVPVYWSHCGTSRALHRQYLDTPPLQTMEDIAALGREVVERGFKALKTNIVFPGEPASAYFPCFNPGSGTTDQNITPQLLDHIVTLMGTFKDAVGPEVGLCLDLNFNLKPEGCMRVARALEPLQLLWLEIDMYAPEAMRQITESTDTKICTGENLYYMRDFIPYFEQRAADIFMIDIPWNGFAQSKKIGDLAEVYQFNVAPHNYYSHLASFVGASLCATLSNVRIMEIDIDDVPWREELVTQVPEIVDGEMKVPSGPGWGTELNVAALEAHPWENKKSAW